MEVIANRTDSTTLRKPGIVRCMFGSRFVRWLATVVVVGLVLAVSFGVVGEFFIELAREKGLYDQPSERLSGFMTALSAFVTQTWFMALTGVAVGFAGGMWVDSLLRKRETAPNSGAGDGIDRVVLADRASVIAAKVSAMYGQWKADHTIAWSEDRLRPGDSQSSADNVNRKYIERYSEQYNAEVWSVIGMARKFVVVDSSTHFNLSHGVSNASDLNAIVVLLGHIEASLRHDQPDLPMFDKHAERVKQMAISRAAVPDSQPPTDNATDKSQ